MFKLHSFLLYVLAILTSFFVGLIIADLLEAGKYQGLAAGAIVLGYGVVGAGIGLMLALFIAWKANRKTVVRLNGVLAVIILVFIVYFHFKYKERREAQKQENERIERPATPTAEPVQLNARLSL